MTIPAGAEVPAPDDLAGADVVHAVDGDGSAVCAGRIRVEPIGDVAWSQVPLTQRCPLCHVLLAT